MPLANDRRAFKYVILYGYDDNFNQGFSEDQFWSFMREQKLAEGGFSAGTARAMFKDWSDNHTEVYEMSPSEVESAKPPEYQISQESSWK
ncbi:uncharacterized protein KY384_000127 [Bacidia gigantensis]|uniref:uncharacterized protein n=1 Tax=Bacidia gigantensis TaxID=2732470 RepID=UPI001D03CCA7|nr:uncharacterized protein KY384_000127 [Bacidia gigantensis]KAG8526134.1 hypothetical protein KY384_000127 [Bacidia gigantensis]